MTSPVHYSSASVEWSTPQDFFDKLDAEFGGLMLDVCATDENSKCTAFYDEAQDGLSRPWAVFKRAWMNPPYGRTIGLWVAKAAAEAKLGATVVALLPARTDTRWWHDHIQDKPGVEVRFIKGRLKFGGAKSGAPFPSVVVIFRGWEAVS